MSIDFEGELIKYSITGDVANLINILRYFETKINKISVISNKKIETIAEKCIQNFLKHQ